MNNKSSIRTINVLFLIVLILQAANLLFMWMPQYVRLTLNQAFFVFLPAYLYLRLTRQPIRARVSWRWTGWKAGLLSLLLGMGLYPLSAVSGGVLQQILGYTTFELPADAIPTTIGMGVLAVIAYAVMPPLCEEFLFRGVIQPVYERLGGWFAVLFVSFLFIVFHLSLLQGLSIIPLALALGFVYYKTRSLQASILTHFGANALAALVLTQGVFPTGIDGVLFTPGGILGGLLAALVAFLGLLRLSRSETDPAQPPPPPELEDSQPTARRRVLAQWWPLLAAGFVYVTFIAIEVTFSRSPEIASPPLEAAPLLLVGDQTRRYDIYNVADELVGEGTCRLASDGQVVSLTCESWVQAYEVRQNGSLWSSITGERRDEATWGAEDGRLFSGSSVFTATEMDYRSETNWSTDEAGIWVDITATNLEETFFLPWEDTPQTEVRDLLVVTDFTAPWQISGLDFEAGVLGRLVRFHPHTWRPATQDQGPVAHAWVVRTVSVEELSLAAGKEALRVNLGPSHIAWYDGEEVGPVKFFNGMETWVEKE